jgi:nicotinamide-nucleotide amidase
MKLFDLATLKSVGNKLKSRKQTIAIAESVTSGLLQFAFSQMPDARLFYQGGTTAYNLGQKYKHLDVEPIYADQCNCVSQHVADQMALSVARDFNSDWGIAVTGYATPVPESGDKLFCFYSISNKNKIKAKGKLSHKKADPATVQLNYTNRLLAKFARL